MDPLDALLYNLDTCSRVPPGARVSNSKEFIVIEDATPTQPFWRWVSGDSRERAVQTISREVRLTIRLCKSIMESHWLVQVGGESPEYHTRMQELLRIRKSLLGLPAGINNLHLTYNSDANVCAYLTQLLADVNAFVVTLTEFLIEKGCSPSGVALVFAPKHTDD